MRLLKLIHELSLGDKYCSDDDMEILGITNISSNVKPGFIFVAIKGFKLDGHDYVQEAIKSGAVAIVTERNVTVNDGIVQINVTNTRKALSKLCSRFFCHPSRKIKVIGVTGTNGKTTTTYLIKSIIENSHSYVGLSDGIQTSEEGSSGDVKTGLIGTVEYLIGEKSLPAVETTPESVNLHYMLSKMVDRNLQYAVMEVSSQSLTQYRTYDVEFHAAVFTNLTSEHLDYHNTLAEYVEAKSRLFQRLKGNAFAILNADDEASNYLAQKTDAIPLWYGIKNRADVCCKVMEHFPDSTVVVLSYGNDEIEIKIPLLGLYNVYNVLAATACCLASGISLDAVKRGVEAFRNVPGRMESVDCGQRFKVFIDYAHTAHALDAVLQSIRKVMHNKGRLLTVFGCGGDRDREKRPEMGRVAVEYSDNVWITNDNPRSEDPEKIIMDIQRGMMKGASYCIQPDRSMAIREAIIGAKPDDIVLIAGKGHETGQIVGNRVFEFSDKDVANRILMALAGNN